VRTRVEELPESRVRLEVEVPESDVRHAVEHAASDLAGSIRVPGFRKGRVPLPVVMARVGRETLMSEAVRSHIDGWFWNAAATSGLRPISRPEVEFEGLPADDGPFRFTATVSVLPKPEVADWTELEVPAYEPEVPPELVDAEIEQLRASVAELVPAGDRRVQEGDVVVLDIVGDEVPAQRDYVVDVGSGRLVEEIEETLIGASAGETKEVELEVGEGKTATVGVTVKDVKEKRLPEADDALARAASEFDTIAELREEIEARLREQVEAELEVKFREDAVDALVAASPVDGAGPLVDRRAVELWAGLTRSLEQRGISPETYLTMTGQSQEQVLARMRAEAERSVKREIVLDAVADKLGVDVSDEEIESLIREQAAESGDDPEQTLAAMRGHGSFEQLRGDLRLRKALDEVVAGVKRIPADVAAAREKLWTPEKEEKGGAGMKIWTPEREEAR
jgi:trigger factor